MSKSKKQKKLDTKTLLKDAEKIFSFIDKFEALDLEKTNLDKLEKEINGIQKSFKDKYKKYINKEDLEKFENDLDSKK